MDACGFDLEFIFVIYVWEGNARDRLDSRTLINNNLRPGSQIYTTIFQIHREINFLLEL
jgi:uncharacterized RmlC-like cupin family protein